MPVPQIVHVDDVVDEAYRPALHDVHALDLALEYFPEAQVPETAVSPEAAQYDPAGHDEHELWPADAWKVPMAHNVHAEAPSVEYDPDGHVEQLD